MLAVAYMIHKVVVCAKIAVLGQSCKTHRPPPIPHCSISTDKDFNFSLG